MYQVNKFVCERQFSHEVFVVGGMINVNVRNQEGYIDFGYCIPTLSWPRDEATQDVMLEDKFHFSTQQEWVKPILRQWMKKHKDLIETSLNESLVLV
ncbi:hypothetical protein ACFYKX_11180 [Cytobacillus sp. FJAT-54145]|uniref:Uncharacterized protein n=1 Tax=Cytobacillus spartinae TaxID=3299023 RepID=A0ABW6KAE1_9BACI